MGQVKRWLMELEYAFNDDGDEFTSHLLRLIRRAGPQDKARLRRVYPQEVAAYEMWQLGQEGKEDRLDCPGTQEGAGDLR